MTLTPHRGNADDPDDLRNGVMPPTVRILFFTTQHYTFYDFIINKARGKSGPLFNFDVHEDVRLTNDATIEKDEV